MKSVESKIKRTIFARLFEDEDLLETIAAAAKQNKINSGFFFLIGTLKNAVLGFYKEGKYITTNKGKQYFFNTSAIFQTLFTSPPFPNGKRYFWQKLFFH